MMHSKNTAIILVTYNGWQLTENCLKDLSPLTECKGSENFVIAVVDNGSSDGTEENIRKEFPQVHIYPQASNLGFGVANNAAIKGLMEDGIKFDTICLLNNDTRFEANAIIQLRKDFDFAMSHSEIGVTNCVMVPTILNADGSQQNNYFAGLGPDGIGYTQFILNAFRSQAAAARVLEGIPARTNVERFEQVHWASAVCWMLSAELWNRVGGFDHNIFMYYEDADLALRLRSAGARFYLIKRCAITHLGGGSAKSSFSRALQHDLSQQYVFKKHFVIRGLMLSKFFRILRSSFRAVATLPHLGSAEKRQYFKHHLALLKEALL